MQAKPQPLIDYVKTKNSGAGMDAERVHAGVCPARQPRISGRTCWWSDPGRLKAMAEKFGPMQIVYSQARPIRTTAAARS